MKIDFSKVEVQMTVEGDPMVVDFRKGLGNFIWANSRDIVVSDFGKEIYYSEGPITVHEITAKEILSILETSTATAPAKRALTQLLILKKQDNGNNDNN